MKKTDYYYLPAPGNIEDNISIEDITKIARSILGPWVSISFPGAHHGQHGGIRETSYELETYTGRLIGTLDLHYKWEWPKGLPPYDDNPNVPKTNVKRIVGWHMDDESFMNWSGGEAETLEQALGNAFKSLLSIPPQAGWSEQWLRDIKAPLEYNKDYIKFYWSEDEVAKRYR